MIWGPWWSLAFTGVIVLAANLLPVLVLVALNRDEGVALVDLANTNFLFVGTASGLTMAAAAIALAAVRPGLSPRAYLNLNAVPIAALAPWLAAAVGLVAAVVAVGVTLERPQSPEVWRAILESNSALSVAFIAVIVAPVAEEILFRGFLLEGLKASRLGTVGAILVSSLLWSVIHVGYDVFDIALLILVGVVIGIARIRTGSLITCIVMHAVFNALSLSLIFWGLSA